MLTSSDLTRGQWQQELNQLETAQTPEASTRRKQLRRKIRNSQDEER